MCISSNEKQLECGHMPNVMATLPNIGGALCSKLQSLADPAAGMPSSNAANIGEHKIWTQVNFARAKLRQGARAPKNIYIWYTRAADGQTSCKVWLASG